MGRAIENTAIRWRCSAMADVLPLTCRRIATRSAGSLSAIPSTARIFAFSRSCLSLRERFFIFLRALRALRGCRRPAFLLFHHAEVDLAAFQIDPGDGHAQQIAEAIAVAGAMAGQRVRGAVEEVMVVAERFDAHQPFGRQLARLGRTARSSRRPSPRLPSPRRCGCSGRPAA